MGLARKLCRWASLGAQSLPVARGHGRGSLHGRGFCSVTNVGKLQPFTLESLGFTDDGQEVPQTSTTAFVEIAKRPPRISAPHVAKPSQREMKQEASPEEMKQAALAASNILAGIAGMQLTTQKKPARTVQVAAKQVALDGEEMVVKAAPVLKDMGRAEQETTQLRHPWPEWLDFLEDLRAKAYFEGAEQGVEEGKHMFESCAAVRHAICAFGRTHADIFRSLSRKDLRVLANYGCPSLERKASNSSKRLRAHFLIPEGEVCQHCKLKMTCPRAFLVPPTKLPMNMLDVLRIITGFATNVWPNADCFTSYPMELEIALCNLLKEILTFNGLPRKAPEDTERSPLEPVHTKSKVKDSPPVDQKPGDWTCPNCEFLNFSRNRRCRECRVFRPPQEEQKRMLGDWECSQCRYMNFSKNTQCRECNADRLSRVKWTGGERLSDDYRPARRQGKSAEKLYEASDDEEGGDTTSVAEANSECNADFTDIEDKVLSKSSSTASRKRMSKITFKWNEDKQKERRSLQTHGRGRTLSSRVPPSLHKF